MDFLEPPDWYEPPERLAAPMPTGSLNRIGTPGDVHDIDGIEGVGPPLPVDPFPDWAHFTAA